VLATVPMFASRWLFRGYGSSTSMRPVDAALAGTDSLVLLDEAHLAHRLACLAEPVASADFVGTTRMLPGERAGCRVVALTATGEHQGERFDLDGEDHANDLIRRRLTAAKTTTIRETNRQRLASVLAEEACAALVAAGEPSTCIVFTNTPARARTVHEAILERSRRWDPRPEVLLLTGRMREREAQVLRGRILSPEQGMAAERDRSVHRERSLVVVATQTLEVGADVDADHLVTETAGVRALIQRLGRLNRLGQSEQATAVICHAPDLRESLYGEEPALVWQRLCDRAAVGPLSLCPAVVGQVLGEPGDAPKDPPELLPAHLWEWAKTSLPPRGEAPVGLFFSDEDDDVRSLSVCWRGSLPALGLPLWPSVSAGETVELPLGELRAFLEERDVATVSRLAGDGSTLEVAALSDLGPGDVVVLPSDTGGYDPEGWNPAARGEILDVGVLSAGVLPLAPSTLSNLLVDPTERAVARTLLEQLTGGEDSEASEPLEPEKESRIVRELIAQLRGSRPHLWLSDEEWLTFCDSLWGDVERPVDNVAYLARPPRQKVGGSAPLRSDALEELSFDAMSVELADHLGSVGAAAGKIALAVGLPEAVRASVELAGRLHDLGKADPRFQRWLDPRKEAPNLLAKSSVRRTEMEAVRVGTGWPRGGRHEVVSARLARTYLEAKGLNGVDADLVMHLVISHHGHGRPSIRSVADSLNKRVEVDFDGVSVAASGNLSRPEWDQPARFRRLCERYGYWGLALLEAVVRQADQAVSSMVAS
jgi:CRISPR-associated endonuclease/helicase Cas3